MVMIHLLLFCMLFFQEVQGGLLVYIFRIYFFNLNHLSGSLIKAAHIIKKTHYTNSYNNILKQQKKNPAAK